MAGGAVLNPAMATFLIDVPVPSMGATVSELVVISLKVAPGDRVTKGQKLAELESEKSVFDYEAPGDGTVVALEAKPGQSLVPGALFLRLETADASLRHLESKGAPAPVTASAPAPGDRLMAQEAAKKASQVARSIGNRGRGGGI